MNKFAIFLRAVNVSGKNLIPMALLKQELIENGFYDVKTYIQSGNILVSSSLEKQQVLSTIEQLIKNKFSLDISVFVFEKDDLYQAIKQNPFPSTIPGNHLFFTFLSNIPSEELYAQSRLIPLGLEEFQLIGQVVYFHLPNGMARSILNNGFFEKKWKIHATGRNLNTILKMYELMQ